MNKIFGLVTTSFCFSEQEINNSIANRKIHFEALRHAHGLIAKADALDVALEPTVHTENT